MATIKRYISPKVDKRGMSEIFFRISLTKNVKYRVKSGIYINATRFKDGEIIKPRANQKEIVLLRGIERSLEEIENALLDFFVTVPAQSVSRDMIETIVERFHNWDGDEMQGNEKHHGFFDTFNDFLASRDFSKSRTNGYKTLCRALHRYEVHRATIREGNYKIDLDTFSADDLADFEKFFRTEWELYEQYPEIYIQYPAEMRTQHKTHKPQKRGDNIVVNVMNRIRAFYNWCIAQELTTNNPFCKYAIKSERYGTPYYLTIEERDRIAEYDLSSRPALAIQRDIFIFQCLVGCRVSDLKRLKKTDVINGAIEYVASKTKKERGDIIRVPLGGRARNLIQKYEGNNDNRLFPFISDQRYNDAIKEICKICGIDRVVTIINPTTGRDEKHPIYEIASSHMARRTFIGNLYKKVKDPNLVGSMSGHKEGSRAFARYREIDDDIKRELINLIE